jgi:hypothetical protein
LNKKIPPNAVAAAPHLSWMVVRIIRYAARKNLIAVVARERVIRIL